MASRHQRSSGPTARPQAPAERLVRALEALASAGLWSALKRASERVSLADLDESQGGQDTPTLERYVAATRTSAAAILGARLLKAAETFSDEGLPEVDGVVLGALAARGVKTAQRRKLDLSRAAQGGEVTRG